MVSRVEEKKGKEEANVGRTTRAATYLLQAFLGHFLKVLNVPRPTLHI